MKKPFTEQEQEIMNLLVKAHNKFVEMEQMHPDHMREWIDGVHKCQNVLKGRVVTRDYPDIFYSALVNESELDGTLDSEEDQQQQDGLIEYSYIEVDGRRVRIPNRYEPKRKNRFMLTFPTEFNIPQYFVRGHTKPKLTRQGWSNIEIELMDPIGPSMSQRVMDYIRGGLWIHNVPFDLIMESLDPTGVVIERWKLENCEVVEFDFGENDYASDDISTIKLKIKPTDCILMF